MIVGLCWAGNPGHRNNANRSIPAHELAPLFVLEGVEWRAFCREGWTPDMAAYLPNAIPDLSTDWYDTAQALRGVDLVVTVDTALAHVAGAMGLPTWLLLHAVPDFRWGLSRDSTPWYKVVRIFRQRAAGEWPAVIARVADALTLEVQARRLAA